MHKELIEFLKERISSDTNTPYDWFTVDRCAESFAVFLENNNLDKAAIAALQGEQAAANEGLLRALANPENYIWVKTNNGKDMLQWNGQKDIITMAREALGIKIDIKAELQQAIANAESCKPTCQSSGAGDINYCKAKKVGDRWQCATCGINEPYKSPTKMLDKLSQPDTKDELIEKLKQEAQGHAMERRTVNSILNEIYQLVSGATGEKANWNGSTPVKDFIKQKDERIADLEGKLGAMAVNRERLEQLEFVELENHQLEEKLKDKDEQIRILRDGLLGISRNGCCDKCQEAAQHAKYFLAAADKLEQEQKDEN